ncbi:Fc receptor-like protein 5 isoform X1 [Siphateles boraxobius]|uniref:Fc receptor-like protein 5 isoform X1 n=1 Tax=Siphateles boraxobius TaxID=180520 RepID=UPI004062FC1F
MFRYFVLENKTEEELFFCSVCVCSRLFSSVAGALYEHKLDEPVLSGPSVALEGSVEEFYCEIPGNLTSLAVLYELYVESNPGKMIAEYSSLSGQIATFNVLIKTQHDGRLVCKASEHNNTDIQSPLSQGLDLKVIVPVKDVRIVSHPASNNVWEGQTLTLQCKKSKGTYVSYEWLRKEIPVETPYNRTDDTLIIHRLSVQNTGDYMCVASNRFNDTMTFDSRSDVISVKVKEYVSKPEISLEVEKLEDAGVRAVVTCRSSKGSPINTFRLLNDTDVIEEKTTNRTSAIFHVPVELDRITGRVRCNASNEGNWVLSEPVNLTVESVGGAVMVRPVTHTGRDFQVVGLVLLCKVERGTFPHYRWFLNGSRLQGRGAFYALAWSDDSVLSLSVGPDSAGLYHCEASDRFDNRTSIRSAQMLINEEVVNSVSPVAVLVVLSCFALLNVAVMSCCVYGVVLRRRYSGKYLPIEHRRKMEISVKHEGEEEDDNYPFEEMSEGYEEDVVLADRMSDSAEEEDESVDETLLYEDAVSK